MRYAVLYLVIPLAIFMTSEAAQQVGYAPPAVTPVSAPVPDLLYQPVYAYLDAAADLQTQPEGIRRHIRYLSCHNLPGRDVGAFAREMSFHCNQLSREAFIVQPALVGRLLRVNLKDYGWDAKTWERFAEVEPYYHAQLTQEVDELRDVPYGEMRNGKWVQTEVRRENEKVRKTVTAIAPWLTEAADAKAAVSYLTEQCRSGVPVVRGDWFLSQTAIQADRKVGYYGLLGLGKEEKDFDSLVGFDLKLAQQFRAEQYAVVTRSIVAHNNRRLVRYGKIGGGDWRTLDVRESTGRKNFVRVLDAGFQFDATERIATLPNGLHAFWLNDVDGKRQDVAPDFIASDSTAPGTDRRVHAGLSCIRCHIEGFRPFRDWVRENTQLPFSLGSPGYDTSLRLRQLYHGEIDFERQRDNASYAVAVGRCNGLSLEANAHAYGLVYAAYAERDLTERDIEREMGMTIDVIRAKLAAYGKATGTLDLVLTSIQHEPMTPIRRDHWEEAFSLCQYAIRGIRP